MSNGWTQEEYLKMFGTKEELNEYYEYIAKWDAILKDICVPAKTLEEVSRARFKIE